MNEVLLYLLRSAKPLMKESDLPKLKDYTKEQWLDQVDNVRGMLVTRPGMVSRYCYVHQCFHVVKKVQCAEITLE